ncbi:MAG: hypothetical protein HYU68_06730 [Bacteroidetes bacterium]|nr:hypothetical protein [Bacteroidota bacterium]
MKNKFFLTLIIIFTFVLCANVSFAQVDAFDSVAAITTQGIVKEKETNPSSLASTPTKTEPETTNASEDTGGDKNLGVVFDGASINLSAGANIYFGDIAAYKLFPNPSQFRQHVTGGFKFSVARDIKWGLGAQINYQRGSLIGTRKTGKYSSTVTFQAFFYDLSLQIRYPLSDALFKKNEYNRFKLYGYVGFGSAWYRSQLYDTETLGTKDYEGYIEVETTTKLAQKTLSDKVPKAQTWIIPYGVTLMYKYNYKMDIHIDFTQTATTTDRLDAFSRDWTARDKYDYIGVGVTYNFNRTSDDAPKKRPKKETTKKDVEDDDSSSNNIKPDNSGNKLFGRKRKQSKGNDDELLNIRLKLFETQLKLFEMQYLIGK